MLEWNDKGKWKESGWQRGQAGHPCIPSSLWLWARRGVVWLLSQRREDSTLAPGVAVEVVREGQTLKERQDWAFVGFHAFRGF